MKTDKNILIAFLLNLLFSAVEFVGGLFTGSIAIISDSLHDLADAAAIAISYTLERMSKRKPDKKYTFGYGRYSVIGGALNALILLMGSVMVIFSSVRRLFSPSPIHYDGMIIIAIFGVIVNFLAAYVTHGHGSINEHTVNLHMLEDVLGWIVVLIGAVFMRLTGLWIVDPLLSIAISIFILCHAIKAFRQAMDILLEKTPDHLDPDAIEKRIFSIPGVKGVSHIHLWALDDQTSCATLMVNCTENRSKIKSEIRHILSHLGVQHSIIEIIESDDTAESSMCNIKHNVRSNHCNHH